MYQIMHQDGKARVGILSTAHGQIETPFFMPAATKATGKHITTDDYKEIDIPAIICSAFILSLRPGVEIVKKAGGLHKFMNFNKIIFTDCGGFQMSTKMFLMKSKRGLHFRNPYDHNRVIITPKRIMEIELTLGHDVAMMLDDMSPYRVTEQEARKAMENTHRWGRESLDWHKSMKDKLNPKQLLFGIVQGNFYKDLREESAKYINSLDFDGIAIGGVAIGEPKEKMYEAVDAALPFITEKKPRYVMGVGSPIEILKLISKGIDCFDSVYPTKMSRHSHMFTKNGPLIVDQLIYKEDFTPIEPGCGCHTCTDYTKAYLHHLIKVNEPSAKRLRSIHNLWFITRMVEQAKQAIKESRFKKFKEEFVKNYTKSSGPTT